MSAVSYFGECFAPLHLQDCWFNLQHICSSLNNFSLLFFHLLKPFSSIHLPIQRTTETSISTTRSLSRGTSTKICYFLIGIWIDSIKSRMFRVHPSSEYKGENHGKKPLASSGAFCKTELQKSVIFCRLRALETHKPSMNFSWFLIISHLQPLGLQCGNFTKAFMHSILQIKKLFHFDFWPVHSDDMKVVCRFYNW